MLFDHRPLDQISNEDILGLIDTVTERQFLEFKLTVNYKSDEERFEVLKDVASLANGGGGYLFVGFRENKGVATRFEGLDEAEAESIKKSMLNLAHQYVVERIPDLTIEVRKLTDKFAVLVRVPDTVNRPHMISYQERTAFWSRYHDGKKAMSFSEIRDGLLNDVVLRRLNELAAKVDASSRETKRDAEREEAQRRLQENRQPRLFTEDGKLIAETAYQAFLNEVGDRPFFWISATPETTRDGLLDIENQNFNQLLEHPLGTEIRQNGWGMQFGHFPIEHFSEGIRRGRKDFKYIEVLFNAHLELLVPMEEDFCWGQERKEFEMQPRLRIIVFTEFILCYLLFYTRLMKILNKENEYSYLNICFHKLQGYALPLPEWVSGGTKFPNESFEILNKKIKNDADPQQLTKEILKRFYSSFNIRIDKIPFYSETEEKFVFPVY